ncbi:hypothetical protein PCK1_002093 [Pneumocystis canis]|nr:hypothetical protein PCK1_002093 [Pneumocystis canis]
MKGREDGLLVKQPWLIKWEIPRKGVHVSVGILTLGLYIYRFEARMVTPYLIGLFIPAFGCDIIRFANPAFNRIYIMVLGPLMRPSEENSWNGVIFYLIYSWILRMSQALSRIRFSNIVEIGDVDEALRLIEVSKLTLYEKHDFDSDITSSSKIYKIIRDLANGDGDKFIDEWNMKIIRERVLVKGFTEDQLAECIKEYQDLGVWQLRLDGSKLNFITGNNENVTESYTSMDIC